MVTYNIIACVWGATSGLTCGTLYALAIPIVRGVPASPILSQEVYSLTATGGAVGFLLGHFIMRKNKIGSPWRKFGKVIFELSWTLVGYMVAFHIPPLIMHFVYLQNLRENNSRANVRYSVIQK